MIYLLLSILCSTAIFLLFRAFSKFGVHTFTAIVINYMVAAAFGFSLNAKSVDLSAIVNANWLPNAIVLGLIFILLFNVMALTTQKLGASVGSIANKMALVVPVVFAMLYYGDSVSILKISGIILALVGIFLSTLKPKALKDNFNKSDLLLPFILLIGSGFIDTYVKYTEEYYLSSSQDSQLFSASIFFTAFVFGLLTLIVRKKSRSMKGINITAGLVLGLVNYGSIYFLLETFRYSELESSVVFPFNNVGVVILTTVLSLFIFKEKFNRMNKIGIAFSVIAVILIAFGR